MLKDVGLLVNCGRWRLLKEEQSGSVMINFVTAVEVLDGESSEAIQDVVSRWSRAGWRKMVRREREAHRQERLEREQSKHFKKGVKRGKDRRH